MAVETQSRILVSCFGNLGDARYTSICAGIVWARFLVKRILHLLMEFIKLIITIGQIDSGEATLLHVQ